MRPLKKSVCFVDFVAPHCGVCTKYASDPCFAWVPALLVASHPELFERSHEFFRGYKLA